jgi:AraC family ethanolamine operon transcriptional activator
MDGLNVDSKPRTIFARSVVTHDADEQAGELYGWHQIYDQLTSGRFVGSIAEIRLNGMQVFSERTNQSLRQTCEVPVDSCWFGIPVPGKCGGRIQSRVIGEGVLAVRPGGTEFELITPAGYEILGIVASNEAVRRHAEMVEHATAAHVLPRGEVSCIGDKRLSTLYASLQMLLSEFQNAEQHAFPLMKQGLEATVLELLFDSGALQGEQRMVLPSAARRRSIVSEARHFVIANRERPIGVPELCEHLHVSRRTLQYCFQQILGMAPHGYLRAIRLNGARRALRRARYECKTVQDVAGAWGFWHFGQFAADYRKLFGIRPSETLKCGR